jgi:hypothetical protein
MSIETQHGRGGRRVELFVGLSHGLEGACHECIGGQQVEGTLPARALLAQQWLEHPACGIEANDTRLADAARRVAA